jgi:O-antigen ligase
MHNSVIHALVQTGLAGTIPFLAAFVFGWILLIRILRNFSSIPTEHRLLSVQAGGMLTFFTIRSIAESSGAFFGVDWLILSLVLLYFQMVHNSYVGREASA